MRARRKMRKNEIVAWLDEDEGIRYGKIQDGLVREAHLTVKGIPRMTNNLVTIAETELLPTVMWGRGILGIADTIFPHPKAWRFNGSELPLDELTVKHLTEIFRMIHNKIIPPSCIATWEMKHTPKEGVRFGGLQPLSSLIPWEKIGKRYGGMLLTPKDFMTNFKLILHRALFTRSQNPTAPSGLCRLCHNTKETIEHLGDCPTLRPIFEWFEKVSEITLDGNLGRLLGLSGDPPPHLTPHPTHYT